MRKILFLGLVLAVSSGGTAPSIPQMRMTALEILSGDQGDGQIGHKERTAKAQNHSWVG